MLAEDPSLANKGAARRASASDIRGIVLSPTRELAEQIAAEATALTRNTGLVVQTAVGGTNKRFMLQKTQREGCHLLVATPGRLNDLLSDERSNIGAPDLAAMVLDEADRMLDVGFEKELNSILDMLPSPQDKERQTMLVSATIPDSVIRLARSMVRAHNFEFVQTIAENDTLTHDRVPQRMVPAKSWANMLPTMTELIEREAAKASENPESKPFKAIVYFNTTAMVQMAGEMGFRRRREGMSTLPAWSIHSKLTQQQRTRAAESFRRAKTGVLYSSDVTARGMDFPDVTHVIQMDAPSDREMYIHRLGRTGRQEKQGEGWLILSPSAVGTARKMLSGLPIKQDSSLASADVDVFAEDAESFGQHHDESRSIISTLDRSILSSAYMSLFGQAARPHERAEELHAWVTRVWGWSETPSMSMRLIRNLGLDARSEFLNVESGDGFRSRDRDSSDRGSRFGGPREDDDPFNAMRRNVRTDDARGGRGFDRRGGDRRGFDRRGGDRRGGFSSRGRGRSEREDYGW